MARAGRRRRSSEPRVATTTRLVSGERLCGAGTKRYLNKGRISFVVQAFKGTGEQAVCEIVLPWTIRQSPERGGCCDSLAFDNDGVIESLPSVTDCPKMKRNFINVIRT